VSLRGTVLHNGGQLAIRQVGGLILGLCAVLLLTRLLGPGTYGIYAAALALQLVTGTLAGWGVSTFLVRHEGADEPDERYHQASSFLLVAGGGVVVAAALALPLIERLSRLDGLAMPALALFALLPVQLLATVPMAKVERALAFHVVARIELTGMGTFLLASVPLALAGAGVWAPVAALWLQHLLQAAGYFTAAHYRPCWLWSGPAARAMLAFGAAFAASLFLWQARRLANPLIVGRYLGSEAVGWVAVATQIVTQLGTLSAVAWRLSLPVLARMQADPHRTGRTVSEGMQIQALLVGPPLIAFGWVGDWLVPALFGSAWAPLMVIYSAIAIGFLTNAMFQLHSAALYVRKLNLQMAVFHALHIASLMGLAAATVPHVGLAGYAWAEIGALASYAALHMLARRCMTDLAYGHALALWTAFALAIALPGTPVVGALLLALALALPATRALLLNLWQQGREVRA
jgi:PST family polysaccharide transporter